MQKSGLQGSGPGKWPSKGQFWSLQPVIGCIVDSSGVVGSWDTEVGSVFDVVFKLVVGVVMTVDVGDSGNLVVLPEQEYLICPYSMYKNHYSEFTRKRF